MPIERAIFTSAETVHGSGYHVVCHSDGLSQTETRELAAWGPSHDSLAAAGDAAESVNFFALTSGTYCVSLTVVAGEEYSGRGLRIFTTCLVVAPQDMLRFANNPFALLRAATAAGALDVPATLPERLSSIELGGRAARVDHTLLYRLSLRLSSDTIVKLITEIFAHRQCAIATDVDRRLLAAGIFNTLPVERRLELSMSTGLRYSAKRPLRLLLLPIDADMELANVRRTGIPLCEVHSERDNASKSMRPIPLSARA